MVLFVGPIAPAYLVELCDPHKVHGAPSPSIQRNRVFSSVQFARTSTRQKRAFAVVGPSIWNGLPLSICSLPKTLSQTFLSQLKAVLFGRAGVGSASE